MACELAVQDVVYAVVSTGAAPVEDLARKERKRIMELIESQGMPLGSYLKFEVAMKGQKVVPPRLHPPTHKQSIADAAEQYLVLCSRFSKFSLNCA